ncbi:MAG TPA: hypothetical protein VGC55_19000 [Dokdonella sp.]
MAADAHWIALLKSTVDGAHASRFSDATPALVEHARSSALGRRMLALRLESEAPALFNLPSAANDPAWIEHHPAALFSGERLRGAALDLGALAFSPALRARVERSEVLRLREAVGAARLSFALSTDPWRGGLPDAVRHCALAGLARVLHDAEAIAELVRQRGRIELFTFASARHPLFGERVALAFPPVTAGERRDVWLPAATVAHYLEAAGESAAGAHL